MSTDWQPIETAPKDESPILVMRAGYAATPYAVVYFDTATKHKTHPWCIEDTDHHYHKDWPTHWMPLPPAHGKEGR